MTKTIILLVCFIFVATATKQEYNYSVQKNIHPDHIVQINQAGIDIIKFFEGFKSSPYQDSAGHWTIGYGHKILDYEKFDQISQDQAEYLLTKDIQQAENAINRLVKVSLNQNQYSALVSFVYNIGAGNFAKSTLLKNLNDRNYNQVSKEIRRWVYVNGRVSSGLVKRRKAESELFNQSKSK